MKVLVLASVSACVIISLFVARAISIQHDRDQGKSTISDGVCGFEPSVVDLGRQPWLAAVPFHAHFANHTTRPVQITAISPSCGCTVIDLARYVGRTLEPESLIDIEGQFEVGGMPGRTTKIIDLMLNTGAVHVVRLSADVQSTYTIIPGELDIGSIDLAADELATAKAIFRSDQANVLSCKSDSAWLRCAFAARSLSETEVIASVDPSLMRSGIQVGRLTIISDDASRPHYSISVKAVGVQALRTTPQALFLQEGEEALVRLIAQDGAPVSISNVLFDETYLKVSIQNTDQLLVRLLVKSPRPLVAKAIDSVGRSVRLGVWSLSE